MKHFISITLLLFCNLIFSQEEFSLEIIEQRNQELSRFNIELSQIQKDIELQTKILEDSKLSVKKQLQTLNNLNDNYEKRIKNLEEREKTITITNAEIAYNELVYLRAKVNPSKILLDSQNAFTKITGVSDLKDFSGFNDWLKEYKSWYEKKGKDDQYYEMVNQALTLVSNESEKIPLYGSIVNVVLNGLMNIFQDKQARSLRDKTPEMLELYYTLSQFEQEKSNIDFSMKELNRKMDGFKEELDDYINQQNKYYNIVQGDFNRYIDTTTDSEEKSLKKNFAKKVKLKVTQNIENEETIKKVQKFVNSTIILRTEYAKMCSEIIENLDNYSKLIQKYEDNDQYPLEFRNKISSINGSIESLKKTYLENVKNPKKWIYDSHGLFQ